MIKIYYLYKRVWGEDMLSKLFSFGVSGIDGYMVTVETHVSNGMPAMEIVGYIYHIKKLHK